MFVNVNNSWWWCINYFLCVGLTTIINPLNAELNPSCHLLALLGGATIVVVSRLRVNEQFEQSV